MHLQIAIFSFMSNSFFVLSATPFSITVHLSFLSTLAGDEAANSNESNWSMDCSTVQRVKTLHISSPILAAKSPFFYKVPVARQLLFVY